MTQNFLQAETDSATIEESSMVSYYQDYSYAIDMPVLKINDSGKIENISLNNEKILNEVNYNSEEKRVHINIITINIANKIIDELSKFWKSKKNIKSLVRDVNKRNVFIFCKNMLTISETRSILGDIQKYITYFEIKHVIYCLLSDAEDCSLQDSSKYKILKRTYYKIANICSANPNKKADKKTIALVNLQMENLFELMSIEKASEIFLY